MPRAKKTRKLINITQPTKLERLAIKKLVSWITSMAETLISFHARNPSAADDVLHKQIEFTRNYLECNLPGTYYDELFKEVLESLIQLFIRTNWSEHDGRWDAFARIIDIALSKKLTVLSMYDGWEIFEAAFEAKCEELTGLQYLDLPNNAREHVVIKLLEQAHGLRRLTMYAMQTMNILRCMVQNCRLVEELIFSDCGVTDDDIDILIELPNLRNVELNREHGVSEMGIEKLLISCENLERLEIYPSRGILEVIERVSKLKEASGKQLKLNSFNNYSGETLEQLQISFRNCPFIQELKLHKNKKYIVRDQIYLEPVKELQHLRKLYLGAFDFYTDRVNEVLKAKGRNLTDLHLLNVTEMDLHSLKYINATCPRLQNYALLGCSFAKETLVDELNNEMEISSLESVKSFTLRLWNDASPPLEQLHFLLANHPRVEFLEINDTKMLQDAIMAVLDKNPESLTYLRYFETNERLSMLVIDRIVQNCIYPLEVKAKLLT